MYRFTLNAGHGLNTPGKRIPKELDPKETREWQLNARICDKVEALLQDYTGWEMLRLDDPTGVVDVSLKDRTTAANAWGAQEYYSIHHNANKGKPWNGGGIEVYIHPKASDAAEKMQKLLYAGLIAHTGLEGNRAKPLRTANYQELRETKMPAVLLELGFMDSRVDAPIILTEEYADQCAAAIVDVIVRRGKLVLKQNTQGVAVHLPILRKGDTGARVQALQHLLIGWGYSCGKAGADGVFGPDTEHAVECLQEDCDLMPGGIVDSNTWAKLLGA